jgi:hypothetical protein
MVAGLLLAALLEPRVMAQSLGSNCGLRSLQSLCELSGKQLDEMQMWGLYDKLQGEECSFLDVVNAGKPVGLILGVACVLGQQLPRLAWGATDNCGAVA